MLLLLVFLFLLLLLLIPCSELHFKFGQIGSVIAEMSMLLLLLLVFGQNWFSNCQNIADIEFVRLVVCIAIFFCLNNL